MKSKMIDISDWEGFPNYEKSQINSDAYAQILEYLLKKGIDINHPHCKYYEKKYIEEYTNLFFAKNDLGLYLKNLDNNIIRWFADFNTKTAEVFYERNV